MKRKHLSNFKKHVILTTVVALFTCTIFVVYSCEQSENTISSPALESEYNTNVGMPLALARIINMANNLQLLTEESASTKFSVSIQAIGTNSQRDARGLIENSY